MNDVKPKNVPDDAWGYYLYLKKEYKYVVEGDIEGSGDEVAIRRFEVFKAYERVILGKMTRLCWERLERAIYGVCGGCVHGGIGFWFCGVLEHVIELRDYDYSQVLPKHKREAKVKKALKSVDALCAQLEGLVDDVVYSGLVSSAGLRELNEMKYSFSNYDGNGRIFFKKTTVNNPACIQVVRGLWDIFKECEHDDLVSPIAYLASGILDDDVSARSVREILGL